MTESLTFSDLDPNWGNIPLDYDPEEAKTYWASAREFLTQVIKWGELYRKLDYNASKPQDERDELSAKFSLESKALESKVDEFALSCASVGLEPISLDWVKSNLADSRVATRLREKVYRRPKVSPPVSLQEL